MSPRFLVFAMVFAALGAVRAADDPEFAPQPPIQPLTPAEQAKTFQLPPGYRIECVLSEPEIKEPTIATFDGDGRLYVAEMRTYMQDVDGKAEFDPVSCVSLHWSSRNDGVFDKHTVFADKLLLPRMIQPLEKGRVIIGETNTSDLYLYTDTDGDGVADKKELWFKGGPRGGNLEHQPNGLLWAMDNTMYSTYNAYRLRWTPEGPERETTAANGGQWGLAQDDVGRVFFMNAGGEKGPQSFQVPVVYGAFNPAEQMERGFDEVFPLPGKADVQGGPSRFRKEDGSLNHFTATCGAEVYRDDRLPAELRGNLFFAEPVGRLVRRAVVQEKDGLTVLSNPYQAERSEFIRSSDQLFRPVNLTAGPDGALYIVDMYRGIIQEGQWVREGSYLRKVVQQHGFDKAVSRGRVWRVVHETTKPRQVPKLSEETPAQLLNHFGDTSGWIRDYAQKLIVLSQDKSLVPALTEIAKTATDPLARLHAIWTLDGLQAVDTNLATALLSDTDPRLRSAAIRVSESLIKKGDAILQKTVEGMTRDKEGKVALQSALTARLLSWPSAREGFVQLASMAREPGIRSLAEGVLRPPATNDISKFTPEEKKLFHAGQETFESLCATCHGIDGKGLPMVGGLPDQRLAPALANSKLVNGLKTGPMLVLLHGLTGDLDGQKYEGQMVSMGTFDDAWIAGVLTFIKNSFGNAGGFIKPADVAALRAQMPTRPQPWTEVELRTALPQPLPHREAWKITASASAKKLPLAIDGDPETRWDTAASQAPGMWFQVELPEAAEISGVWLEYNNSVLDYPRGYTVQLSADGQQWGAPVATGVGARSRTYIEFPPATARYVRITQTGEAKGTYWSIHEVQLLTKGTLAR